MPVTRWLVIPLKPNIQIIRKFIFATIAVLLSLQSATVQAQSRGTETEIIFVQEKEDEARQQLRRILSSYDLDPWIFTQEVRIEVGAQPYSHPILTLNTDFLDSDEQQLSIFVHEKAHWFFSESVPYRAPENGEEVEIIMELRQLYPNAPASDYSTFLHLIVGWVELDAMVELVGKKKRGNCLKRKYSGSQMSHFLRWISATNGTICECSKTLKKLVIFSPNTI